MKDVAVTPMDEGLGYGVSVVNLASSCLATREAEEQDKNDEAL